MDTSLILIALGYSLGCAGFGVYIAGEKRRPAVEGAVFGALLGLIGLMILALLPAGTRSPQPTAADDEAVDWQGIGTAARSASPPLVELSTRRKPRKLLGEVSEPWMGEMDE